MKVRAFGIIGRIYDWIEDWLIRIKGAKRVVWE